MPHIIFNAVMFQILWFTAILTGWMWALIPLVCLVTHFFWVVKSPVVRLACIGLAVAGIIADAVMGAVGIYQFHDDNLMLYGLVPVWLSYMWIGFSFSLPLSLAWLFRSPVLLLAFFSIGGPMSYVGGRALEALSFSNADLWALVLLWFSMALLVIVFGRLGHIRSKKLEEAPAT